MKKNLLLVTALVFFAMSAFAKEGVYMEFKMTSPKVNGTMKGYMAGGDSRNETNVVTSAMPDPMVITVIMHESEPGVIYTINEKNKTYSSIDNHNNLNKDDDAEYDITVLGKEKVNGYNCTHVRIVNKKTQKEKEMWLTKDIPEYERYTAIKSKYLAGSGLYKQLKAKGVEGFMVRIVMTEERMGTMQMDLVKAEKRNIDPSMFSLSGYTNAGSSVAPARGAPNGGVDVQAIQNMTPEERQKYIEQMKQQYQQQPH